MEQLERQFWQIIRSFVIRYSEYSKEKGASPQQVEQIELTFTKLLSSQEIKEVIINKITSIELKSDYHNLIALTLLQDLAKWSYQFYDSLKNSPGTIESIISQSITILSNQQQFHTIVPKQNDLICALLVHPCTMDNIQQFKILFRKLKDVKEFYPSAIRQNQKQSFLKCIEEGIQCAAKFKNIKVVEFIFNNIFAELEVLEQTHQYVSQRLRILKKLIKHLWYFHEDIIYKIAYLVMKYSYQITNNRHLFHYLIPIYQNLQQKLLEKDSIAPLLIYRHVVLNNIEKWLKNGGNYIILQILLSSLSTIFTGRYLKYFMKNYDWNFMETSICQQSLNILYQYIQNRSHQKKYQFELIKLYMNRIHDQIKIFLEEVRHKVKLNESRWKFYQLKKKQYYELIQQMNQKPKKIFKRIQSISNSDIRESVIQKYVKIIKKTCHLQNRSMIDIFSTDNSTSAQLFSYYVEIVLKQCKESNLQEFMRLFTSNFFLTGESQQIGRVMDTITQLYFAHQKQDKRIIKSSDATYTFANAILILNTDLHNPKNEQKISEQNFIKMCKKINDGEDLPVEIIKKTYLNIKKNKINTFRDRENMFGISPSNWLILCTDYQSLSLGYCDSQLQILDEQCLYYFMSDVLKSIIDQKQTAKLQTLVQRYLYDEKVFECEIIEIIRKIVDKKPHIPIHILQKILEFANFKNSKPNERVASYYWLAANLIQNFYDYIPTNLICEFLVFNWNMRIELQDNMYMRQSAEIRRVKKCIKYINKRQSKKSIMDMFSNFLSFKDSDEETQPVLNELNKRINFKSISNNIFDLLKFKDSHKKNGLDFLVSYIHNQQSKLFQEFISCLYLIFNLMYYLDDCDEYGQDLFYELLGVKESQITIRINNLKKKDMKLYNILINYCQFWVLKLLLKEYSIQKVKKTNKKNYQYILQKSYECLNRVDKEVLNDLLKQIQIKKQIDQKMFQAFSKTIEKIYENQVSQVKWFFDRYQPVQINKHGKVKNEKNQSVFNKQSSIRNQSLSSDNRPEEQKGQVAGIDQKREAEIEQNKQQPEIEQKRQKEINQKIQEGIGQNLIRISEQVTQPEVALSLLPSSSVEQNKLIAEIIESAETVIQKLEAEILDIQEEKTTILIQNDHLEMRQDEKYIKTQQAADKENTQVEKQKQQSKEQKQDLDREQSKQQVKIEDHKIQSNEQNGELQVEAKEEQKQNSQVNLQSQFNELNRVTDELKGEKEQEIQHPHAPVQKTSEKISREVSPARSQDEAPLPVVMF